MAEKRSASEQTTILVVDDDAMMRTMFSALLIRWGYTVVEAGDGVEALAAVEQHSVECIVLDVMMPGMDGFEVCRRLRRDPATAHIPVVLATALTAKDKRQQGLEAGADDVVSKPIDAADLRLAVQRVMQAGEG
jgi:CheY-like chemotaxis protein